MLGFRREDGLEVLVSWRSLQAPSVRYGKPAFIGVADAAGFAHDPVPLVGRTVTELLKVEEALLVRTSDGLLFRIAWLDDGLSEPGVPYLEDVRRARPAA